MLTRRHFLKQTSVVVGGLITSTILTLLVLPAIYKWFTDAPAKAVSEVREENA